MNLCISYFFPLFSFNLGMSISPVYPILSLLPLTATNVGSRDGDVFLQVDLLLTSFNKSLSLLPATLAATKPTRTRSTTLWSVLGWTRGALTPVKVIPGVQWCARKVAGTTYRVLLVGDTAVLRQESLVSTPKWNTWWAGWTARWRRTKDTQTGT